MYNSRSVSRRGRTIQRRMVDTGIAIDPTKVKYYMEYLLNNGYVQLPQDPTPSPSPQEPDGTYIYSAHLSLDVSSIVSTQIVAKSFIDSILSSQNIVLTGNETVYIAFQTTLSGTSSNGLQIDLFNLGITTAPFISRIDFGKYYSTTITVRLAFIYSNSTYSIVFLGSTFPDFDGIEVKKNANYPASTTRSYVAFGPSSVSLTNSIVTLVAIGKESE